MSDYNADSTNKLTNTPNVAGSGLSAGVDSGLSSVEAIANGGIQPEQETAGNNYRQETVKTSIKGNGKSFTIGR
jgi:hypothetical protein